MAGTFRGQPFSQRLNAMGDEAEAVYEAVASRGFVRYGLNRPPLKVGDLPLMIRYTPDYLQADRLVEVQGCGRDGVFKLKHEKLESLKQWYAVMPVDLFLYDSKQVRYVYVPLDEVIAYCKRATTGTFSEGKTYYEISVHDLEGWTSYDREKA